MRMSVPLSTLATLLDFPAGVSVTAVDGTAGVAVLTLDGCDAPHLGDDVGDEITAEYSVDTNGRRSFAGFKSPTAPEPEPEPPAQVVAPVTETVGQAPEPTPAPTKRGR